MDVSFWGPSGWQLLHLIAEGGAQDAKSTLDIMPFILPCKYCRKSAIRFRKQDPPSGDLQKWLYDFHNKVNNKLIKQHVEDPKCILPVPAPLFEQIQKRYASILDSQPTEIPGRDFLYCIAYNFDPAEQNVKHHETFWMLLKGSFPFPEFRKHIRIPDFHSRTEYLDSVHSMFSNMKPQKSIQSISQQLAYYKSGCTKKTYKGKTCKKVGTGYTKNRDRKRTYRLTHSRLLSI
jgi:hypothetical protein|uniref:thiol oxidase n=1 Tax=viral metagenome TaxID=1070528 RepID=A0A6C0B286_9ZZZZ